MYVCMYVCIHTYIYIHICNPVGSTSSGVDKKIRDNRDFSKLRFDIERTYFHYVISQWVIILYK